MSELIDIRKKGAIFRGQLLATASAVVLAGYVASINLVEAQDMARPTVWIELGGQMERIEGTSSPFIAPFMVQSPTPAPYHDDIFIDGQSPPNLAFGFDGKLSFQPEGSDWVFSVAARFGRSHEDRTIHQQTPFVPIRTDAHRNYAALYAQITPSSKESHSILDFNIGRDVGFGAFGRNGQSTINAGVRFVQLSTKSTVDAFGRPSIVPHYFYAGGIFASFTDYAMNAQAQRTFHGVGPSLSWDASAALIGNRDDGELTLDWGINAAILFGRQRADVKHASQATHTPGTPSGYYYVTTPYKTARSANRSRRVTVPNLGGFAGFSVKYPNAKISLGYRADFFFNATDTGIDERHTKDLGFYGPFAKISIGLGG